MSRDQVVSNLIYDFTTLTFSVKLAVVRLLREIL